MKKVLITLLCILLLAVLACGGWVAYTYYSADETAVQVPQVVFEGNTVQESSAAWHTPVLGGRLQKEYAYAKDAAAQDFGAFAKTSFSLQVPADAVSTLRVTQDGTEVYNGDAAGFAQFAFTQNGACTAALTVNMPASTETPWGEFTYDFTFAIDIQPSVSFSSDTMQQAEIMTAWVDAGLTGLVPTVETQLSDTVEFIPAGEHTYAAYIPVNYYANTGTWTVTVTLGDETYTHDITVTPRTYDVQHMTIDTGTVNSTMNNPEGPSNWRERVLPLRETADDTKYWTQPFIYPCDNHDVNTEFGLFRYTNGSSSADRHTGVDFDADRGDAVYASNAGRVVLAEYVIYTGNTVVIEHGGGLKTYYFHMDDLTVAENDMVEQGQTIGHVGSTGYSTGPHMHFEVRLGAMAISPWEMLDGTSGLYYTGT